MPPDADLTDPVLYAQLRELAGRIHSERGGPQTLQPTALLHEAWVKLERSTSSFTDEQHYRRTLARAMRQLLVDHARARARKGESQTLTDVGALLSDPADLLALEAALAELESLRPQAAEVVTLRVFGGLTLEEAADAMGVSRRTAARNWRIDRAHLADRLGPPDGDQGGASEP